MVFVADICLPTPDLPSFIFLHMSSRHSIYIHHEVLPTLPRDYPYSVVTYAILNINCAYMSPLFRYEYHPRHH